MSKYIRVIDGVATGDACTTDPRRIFPPDIAAQYVLTDDAPAAPSAPQPAAPDLETLRAQRLAAARAAVDAAARAVVANVSQTEQQTWPTQLAEALELQHFNPEITPDYATVTPLLTLMAEQRGLGETVPELAARVLAAAARYTAAVGVLVGWGQRTERELMAAADAEALMGVSITPPSI